MTSFRAPNTRFSLRDVLVFIAIMGVLFGILAPWLEQRRLQSRSISCQNNLRIIGIHFHTFADQDPKSTFCTGAYNWEQDGCPDVQSWVGDKVLKLKSPGNLLCPANPAVGTEGIYELVTKSIPLSDGLCGQADYEGMTGPVSGYPLAQTVENSPARISLVAAAFLDRGLNTNYTPSWTLVRSYPRLEGTRKAECEVLLISGDPSQRIDTAGPLTRRWIETGPVRACEVPLLADGSIAVTLPEAIQSNPRVFPNERTSLSLAKGGGLVASSLGPPMKAAQLPDGAVQYEAVKAGEALCRRRLPMHSCQPRVVQVKPIENCQFKQDTRGWSAVHTAHGRTWLNMLMADGGVQEFDDLDGDRLLNPGLAGSGEVPVRGQSQPSFRTDTVELPPNGFGSGPDIHVPFKHPWIMDLPIPSSQKDVTSAELLIGNSL